MKESSIVSVVSEVKLRTECSQIFHLNSIEVNQCSERSQRYYFKSSEVKQCSERSQRIHFNSSLSKNTIVSVVRYFILVVVK